MYVTGHSFVYIYVHPLKMMQLCKIHLASARNASVQPYIFFFTFYKIQGIYLGTTQTAWLNRFDKQKVKSVVDMSNLTHI